jgi:hypothetical protein
MAPAAPSPTPLPEKPAPSRIVGRIIVTMTIVTAVVVGIITLGAGRRLVEERKARMAPTNPVPPVTAPATP